MISPTTHMSSDGVQRFQRLYHTCRHRLPGAWAEVRKLIAWLCTVARRSVADADTAASRDLVDASAHDALAELVMFSRRVSADGPSLEARVGEPDQHGIQGARKHERPRRNRCGARTRFAPPAGGTRSAQQLGLTLNRPAGTTDHVLVTGTDAIPLDSGPGPGIGKRVARSPPPHRADCCQTRSRPSRAHPSWQRPRQGTNSA